MARRQKNTGVAELVLMGANPAKRRASHDSLWKLAKRALKNAGTRNPQRWDAARAILTGKKNPPRAKASRRGNPDATEKAAELFEEFHGKAASEVIEMQESDTVRKTYTALGDLVDLTIETPEGKGACIQFAGDGVKVASAPGGKQLYLIGGTQTLDESLEQFGADTTKDFVELGRAVQITYRARKGMNDFRLVDYYHDLGEESKNPPLAFYDRIRQRIYFVGGTYHVEAPGIID